DERTLRQLLNEAAGLPPSASRSFSLDALLIRYAELEPRAAVREAQDLGVGTASLAALFRIWAAADTQAALRALPGIADRRALHGIALELVDVLGGGETAVRRLIEAVPRLDSAELHADIA